jgi:orotate phosphoribosyltransferase
MSYNFAKALLEIGSIKLNFDDLFTWASGIKSPIYTDNRKILSYPVHRDAFVKGLVGLVKDNFLDCNAISGVATAGIAHGAYVAGELDLPFSYVRSSSKAHGLENKIEGVISNHQNIVVVEDLISTGGSAIEAVCCLKETGANVLGVISIFSYNTELARENFKKSNIPFKSLVSVDDLIREANLKDGDKEQLILFFNDL